MRKIFATFILLVVLSIAVFADGDILIGGGISCPPEKPTCTTPPPSGSTPANGTNSTTTNSDSTDNEEEVDSGVLEDVFNYLNKLFG